jgi:hypothetical protein
MVDDTNIDAIKEIIKNYKDLSFDNLQDAISKGLTLDKVLDLTENATENPPTVSDYNLIGVEGVTDSNINNINNSISLLSRNLANNIDKLQAIANGFRNNIIPEDISLNNKIVAAIASVLDEDYNVNINKTINNKEGIKVLIPYEVKDNNVTLPKLAKIFTIDSNATSDNENNITAILEWPEQNITTGKGLFSAKLTIDDSKGNNDGLFKPKKLSVTDSSTVIAKFDIPINSIDDKGEVEFKIVSGIPDRAFLEPAHNFLYKPVVSSKTGKVWLNLNLGSAYASVDRAPYYGRNCLSNPDIKVQSADDYCAFGSKFQWGRKPDGAELFRYDTNSS